MKACIGIVWVSRNCLIITSDYTSLKKNIIKQWWEEQLHKSIHSTAFWMNPCFQYDQENFCNKPEVIGGVMDIIDPKVIKGKNKVMNELKFYPDRLESFGRELAYSSHEILQLGK